MNNQIRPMTLQEYNELLEKIQFRYNDVINYLYAEKAQALTEMYDAILELNYRYVQSNKLEESHNHEPQ